MTVDDGRRNVPDKDGGIEGCGNPLKGSAQEADGDDAEERDDDCQDGKC